VLWWTTDEAAVVRQQHRKIRTSELAICSRGTRAQQRSHFRLTGNELLTVIHYAVAHEVENMGEDWYSMEAGAL
jgi:hypothetical protein